MDGAGLFLRVDRTGAKRWGQRLMVKGKRRDIGLGSYLFHPGRAAAITPCKVLAALRDSGIVLRAAAFSPRLVHKARKRPGGR